jgi:hypothetical protein
MAQQRTREHSGVSGRPERTRIDVATNLALAVTRQQADQQGVPMSQIMSDVLREAIKSLGVRIS